MKIKKEWILYYASLDYTPTSKEIYEWWENKIVGIFDYDFQAEEERTLKIEMSWKKLMDKELKKRDKYWERLVKKLDTNYKQKADEIRISYPTK